jgi:hypothetical protein
MKEENMKEALAQTQQELEEVRDAVIHLSDSINSLATKEEVGIAYKISERRRKRWSTSLLIAGVLILSAVISQWFSSRATADASKDRATAGCAVFNSNKVVITKILDRAQKQGEFPGLTPAQREAIAANNKDFRKDIAPLLDPVDCQDFADHPNKYVDGLG